MSRKGKAAAAAEAAKAEELTDIEKRLMLDHPTVFFAGAYEEYAALDFRSLPLKPDHAHRPFWVCPNGHVYLEQYSPRYAQARDFLVQIAEPCSRPVYIHEYQLEKNALFAAASMGLTASVIIDALEALSKVPVAERVKAFIRDCTVGYGKVKLVLSQGRYYLESNFPSVLRQLNTNDVIKHARVKTVEVRSCPPSPPTHPLPRIQRPAGDPACACVLGTGGGVRGGGRAD